MNALRAVIALGVVALALMGGYLLHSAFAHSSEPRCTDSGVITVPNGAISAAECEQP